MLEEHFQTRNIIPNDAHKEVKTVRNSKSRYVKERKITEL